MRYCREIVERITVAYAGIPIMFVRDLGPENVGGSRILREIELNGTAIPSVYCLLHCLIQQVFRIISPDEGGRLSFLSVDGNYDIVNTALIRQEVGNAVGILSCQTRDEVRSTLRKMSTSTQATDACWIQLLPGNGFEMLEAFKLIVRAQADLYRAVQGRLLGDSLPQIRHFLDLVRAQPLEQLPRFRMRAIDDQELPSWVAGIRTITAMTVDQRFPRNLPMFVTTLAAAEYFKRRCRRSNEEGVWSLEEDDSTPSFERERSVNGHVSRNHNPTQIPVDEFSMLPTWHVRFF
jgi:hypothetical protein